VEDAVDAEAAERLLDETGFVVCPYKDGDVAFFDRPISDERPFLSAVV